MTDPVAPQQPGRHANHPSRDVDARMGARQLASEGMQAAGDGRDQPGASQGAEALLGDGQLAVEDGEGGCRRGHLGQVDPATGVVELSVVEAGRFGGGRRGDVARRGCRLDQCLALLGDDRHQPGAGTPP